MRVYIDVTNPDTFVKFKTTKKYKSKFYFHYSSKKLLEIKVQTFKDIFFMVKHTLHLALSREVS